MIDKWLKAGVVEDGLLRRTTEGSPQGGVISPCLSNVFLHHVLDEWFETEVKPRLRGECTLVRYADDALMAFDNIVDAKRVLSVLGKRLARYGLILHPDKTRLVDFRPKRLQGARHPETDGTTFDFLGLTHVWGRSRNGKDMVRQVTAKSRFARAVAAVSDWCRRNRHWSLRDQHRHLSSMMRGHFAYYGVGGNSRRLRWFANQVVRIWRKWLSRRDRQGVGPMGPLQRIPGTAPVAFSHDPPWLRRREQISLVKNRMREICASGSVRGGDGNIPTYSANDREDRGNVGIIRSPIRASILPDHLVALLRDFCATQRCRLLGRLARLGLPFTRARLPPECGTLGKAGDQIATE